MRKHPEPARVATILTSVASLLFLFSCNKDGDDDTEAPPDPSAEVYQLDLLLDGTAIHRVDQISNDHFVPGMLGTCETGLINCTSFQESIVTDAVSVDDRWSFGMVETFATSNSSPPPDSVNTMAATGPVPFGKFLWNAPVSNYEIVEGVRLEWTDGSGAEWSTDRGAALQSGSAFMITEVVPTGELIGPRFKFRATFNCILYNGSGASKEIVDGEYFGPLITS